jgi:hydroxysqualene synthase
MAGHASLWQEMPSPRQRAAATENFPVASLLLARGVRRQVVAFYRFARAADNVADDPGLGMQARLDRLARFEAGLDGLPGAAEAAELRAALAPGASGLAHARALLRAFRMDARGHPYARWADLRGYCALSADPVGRFLLDVHGEPAETAALTDPLCTALQVLNHLQDLREDHDRLGRVYLPADWLAAAGVAPADLSRDAATPALRRVIDRALDACDDCLARAAPLPAALRDPGLRAQARATLWLAQDLSRALRESDPLARRVAPSRPRVAAAVAQALLWRVSGR